MGLTIHYTLQSTATSHEKARQLVEQLRQVALDLAMSEVSEIMEFSGTDCDFQTANDDRLRWLLVQSRRMTSVGEAYRFVVPSPCLRLFRLAWRGL